MGIAAAKIRVRHLSKIFGPAPEAALDRLRRGVSKEQIYRETGSVVAVADVSFEVGQGEIFVVMGLSGSGKSTLIRCINRLIPPTSGELLIDDVDMVSVDPEGLRQIRLGKVAMVFQHFALFPHRTVAENAEFGLKVRGVAPDERRARALEALDLVGLKAWADAPPDSLSGGMQQRVGLARALAVDPEVLLMDEPFSALDPLIRRGMQEELIQLQRRLAMTIVFITHDLHEALTIGDHVAIMKDGAFVQVGEPEQIVSHPADPYVESFTQDVDRSRVIRAASIMRPAARVPADELNAARPRQGEALYGVDAEGRPVALLAAGESVGTAAGGALRRDFPRVGLGAKLAELFQPCAAGLPVAVLDEAGRLVGVVHPLDVLAELSGEDGAAAAPHAAGHPRPAPSAEPLVAAGPGG